MSAFHRTPAQVATDHDFALRIRRLVFELGWRVPENEYPCVIRRVRERMGPAFAKRADDATIQAAIQGIVAQHPRHFTRRIELFGAIETPDHEN